MYRLFTDGGSRGNPGNAACAAVIFEDDALVSYDAKYLGIATNNCAEYEGLLLGLSLVAKQGIDAVEIFMDSELIVKQIKGEYKVRDEKMLPLWKKSKETLNTLSEYAIKHIPREQNKHADKLVNLVLDNNSQTK